MLFTLEYPAVDIVGGGGRGGVDNFILVSFCRTQRWPPHTLLLKMSNSRSPITLKQMFFCFKFCPRCVVLSSLQYHKHFGMKICSY